MVENSQKILTSMENYAVDSFELVTTHGKSLRSAKASCTLQAFLLNLPARMITSLLFVSSQTSSFQKTG
jgi:hypothetical protein